MSFFGEYFWGDKNAGFAVLYHNMKHGQLSVKEMADFVRERATVEESYAKSMQKLSKMVSGGSHLGTFAPMWEMFRVSSDKLALCHLELSKKLQDLIKEINRYGEEQIKTHKKSKDEMSGTLEAIQLLQCSSQMLQKSRDNYCSRFSEQERLRRESSLNKELEKAELKTRKAAESLRCSVEKYNADRREYEEKMLQSAQIFQDTEITHLRHMKRLVTAYSHSVEDTHVQIGQVYEEFKHNIENKTIEKLIRKFAECKGTGTDRPEPVEYEGLRFSNSLDGVKRTWSKPFRIRGLSRKEKESQPVESLQADCMNYPNVDEDGFTIRPDENMTKNSIECCSSSDSDFDDDGEEPRPIRFQIKPPQSKEKVEDQEIEMKRLRETVECLIQPPSAMLSVRRHKTRTAGGLDATNRDPQICNSEKAAVSLSDTSLPPLTSSCESNSANRSQSLFGPLVEALFESDDFTGCQSCTLTSSPSPFSSSSPENVEDSGLDSPFHPFSEPSPESRPWTPRDDSSTSDSLLAAPSHTEPFHDHDITSAIESEATGYRNAQEKRYVAPTITPPDSATLGDTTVSSIVHDSCDISGFNTSFYQPPPPAPRLQRSGNLTASLNLSLLTPGILSSVLNDRGLSPVSLGTGTSIGISRGPSPVVLGSQESLPLAAAFTEYVSAVFEGRILEGTNMRISGELTLSFPAGILRVFSNTTAPPVLSFRLVHTTYVEHFTPNSDLLFSDLSQSDPNSRDFWLNMSGLTSHLQNLAERYTAPYYNVTLLKYQVLKPNLSAPLYLSSSWKCEPSSTLLCLEYKQNVASLSDVQILLTLDEPVSNLKLDPPAQCAQQRIQWKIPYKPTRDQQEGWGRLSAQWQPLHAPSRPCPAVAQFTSEGSTLSGVDIELVGSGYRMSLVKKRFAAGKYLVC
ncbi:hypothetical protein GDO86_001041 [Hymenochirus boettgeri]|uniref:F-BAR domain only protein 1 n=1 Tax=Hymenochirus boettgeri TaxID=247094 RepID=A0A8T2KDB0_9PIPI|nr:hypothetical protein GDO86_001041 [Hymenochirus boettgeri]